jgi:glycyl-tRNA synthetase beta chain
MLVERELALPLNGLVAIAFDAFPKDMLGDARTALSTFVFERFAGQLREQGATAGEVDAVLSMRPVRLDLVPRQLEAVRAFLALPEAEPLAAANKRVGNILKKSEGGTTATVDTGLLVEPAERSLQEALAQVGPLSHAAFDRGDYTASLQALAALKTPVDAFFDQVMVNAEDPALRANRLGLLAQLHAAMNRVADLSKLAH